MPNHTENILRVTGPTSDLAEFEAACRGVGADYALSPVEIASLYKRETPRVQELTFDGICPVPDDVRSGVYDPRGYEWQRKNWGTKWDAYGPPQLLRLPSGGLVYVFQTAWNPPRAWLRAACVRFKRLHFELFARDEFPYCASIKAYHDDGELTWEECYGESVSRATGTGRP